MRSVEFTDYSDLHVQETKALKNAGIITLTGEYLGLANNPFDDLLEIDIDGKTIKKTE